MCPDMLLIIMWRTPLHVGRLSKMVWHLRSSAPSTKPSTKKSTAGLTLILTTLERHLHHNRLCEFVAMISIATSLIVKLFAAATKRYYCKLYIPWLSSSHSIVSPELLRKSSGGCTRGASLLRSLWNSSFVNIAACEHLFSYVHMCKWLISSQFSVCR